MSNVILGIETSCDETAAAVVVDGHDIRSSIVATQIDLHRPYGGVVPELASRNHLEKIQPVVEQALDTADVRLDDITAVAVTYGPGLASSLLIGLNTAKGIALATNKPFLVINHLEAHLYSPLITTSEVAAFPILALIVSGGHTIMAYAESINDHRILGQTLDDAAGEAFDKVAKLMSLGYPGGPEIERQASTGNPSAISFPRSMLQDANDNFSFSGLKTSVMYYLREHPEASLADVAASFQEAVVDVLVGKLVRTAKRLAVSHLAVSGGVSLNRRLRKRLHETCGAENWTLSLAAPVVYR